jgi:uncharacterized protein YegP (UPF0339 family)
VVNPAAAFEGGFAWGAACGIVFGITLMRTWGKRKGSKMFTPTVRWEKVQTASGWHLRLKAANNEIVMTTENYVDRRSMENALRLARRASGFFAGVKEVDER